jgi:hypothetical protein
MAFAKFLQIGRKEFWLEVTALGKEPINPSPTPSRLVAVERHGRDLYLWWGARWSLVISGA